jgi:hypothetical protein
MGEEKYMPDAIHAEINEIGELHKDTNYKFVIFLLIILVTIHSTVFYFFSTVSSNFLIISIAAYISSLIIAFDIRQHERFTRHELHAVTIHEEILRLQEDIDHTQFLISNKNERK